MKKKKEKRKRKTDSPLKTKKQLITYWVMIRKILYPLGPINQVLSPAPKGEKKQQKNKKKKTTYLINEF